MNQGMNGEGGPRGPQEQGQPAGPQGVPPAQGQGVPQYGQGVPAQPPGIPPQAPSVPPQAPGVPQYGQNTPQQTSGVPPQGQGASPYYQWQNPQAPGSPPQGPGAPPPGQGVPQYSPPPAGQPPAGPPGGPVAPQYYQQQQPTPPSPPRRSRGWRITLWLLIGIVIVGAVVAAGFGVASLLTNKKNSASAEAFKLSDSKSYQEALFDIEHYFYKDYSQAKITAAANASVAKAKKEGETNTGTLENDGLTALLEALGDSHTEYLNPEQNKRLSEDISGSFYGIGVMLRQTPPPPEPGTPEAEKQKDVKRRPIVYSVIKDSPADKAGVKKDDVILSVDGKETLGEPLDLVVSSIRGKKGTTVELKIERKGSAKPLTFKIERDKIQIPEIESKMIDGKYGHVQLFTFDRGAGQKVREAVKSLQAQGAQGIILDLRNNPGGLLDEAVNAASVFINDGVIVSYQTKGHDKVYENASGGAETDLPLVVLVNGGSASSSEITAGALKDRKRGTLVGTKTYGKGSVQKIYELANQGAAKITVALYYLPNGESIDGTGIQPDIVVEDKNDPAKEEQLQLDKAKQVLQDLIDGKPATGMVLLPAA